MTALTPLELLTECFTWQSYKFDWQHVLWTDLNWEEFIKFAVQERVLPGVHGRLQAIGVGSKIPIDVMDFLCAVEEMNRERNRAILAELATVIRLLNKVGIEPVLLKGSAYLATGVYTHPAARYLVDVDLLVPQALLSTGIEVLTRNGFKWDDQDRLGHFRHHHPPLRRAGRVPIELHHSLGMGTCNAILPASEVLNESVRQEFLGAIVRVPSPEHLMVHLIMHSQLQHPYQERIWPPLRAMYDLVLVQRRFEDLLDWSGIERRFRAAGHDGLLALHLAQVRDTLRAKVPLPTRFAGLTHVRWLRRRLIRRVPEVRFVDPVYMFSTVLVRRLRLLQNALKLSGGWKVILTELAKPGVYSRLKADLLEGQGR